MKRADSKIPNMFPSAPKKEMTATHEMDDDPEEDGGSSAGSSN